METVFITGINSFIGKELRDQCELAGFLTTGIDIEPPFSTNVQQADFRDLQTYSDLLKKADYVVHLAAISNASACRKSPIECVNTNVLGTQTLLEAVKSSNVKNFLFASSEWVYSNFEFANPKKEDTTIDIFELHSEYALSKLTSEAFIKQHALKYDSTATILRFGIVYGPRAQPGSAVEQLAFEVAQRDKILIGAKLTGRHFIHVKDIAGGIIKAFKSSGYQIYNLQGDGFTTLQDIIDIAANILNKSPNIIETNPEKPSQRIVCNKKAKEMLSWCPQISLKDGIIEVLHEWGYSS